MAVSKDAGFAMSDINNEIDDELQSDLDCHERVEPVEHCACLMQMWMWKGCFPLSPLSKQKQVNCPCPH